LEPPTGRELPVHDGSERQPKVSKTAHPQFIFASLPKIFPVDLLMKCSRAVAAESKNAAASDSSILCRSSCRDHESEIIAKLCNIAQLCDHFRSIFPWGLVHLVHKRGEPCFS
jgi:hypothetical protein